MADGSAQRKRPEWMLTGPERHELIERMDATVGNHCVGAERLIDLLEPIVARKIAEWLKKHRRMMEVNTDDGVYEYSFTDWQEFYYEATGFTSD